MKITREPSCPDIIEKVSPLIGDSFFGSDGFASLWTHQGGRAVYWLVEENDKIVAVLPGVEFGFKPVVRFYAMPDGCYGRLYFSPSSPPHENVVTALFEALVHTSYVKFYFFDYFHSVEPSATGMETQPCQTTLVDIASPDWEPPNKKLRQQIRKAQREGISLEPFDYDKHFDGFLTLAHMTSRRIGRKQRYSDDFYRALAQLAKQDRRIRWYWCEHNGKPVSSNIFLIEHDTVLHWQAYLDTAFSFLQPSKYIPFTVAKALAKEGITTLNLGATPEEAPGVAYYKSKWGGVSYQYPCYVRKAGLGRLW